ncbi:hypothetical protein PPL_08598 [Heterostelium album PN500]|uniref:Methyltransferase type 11 domain-containing protein n=1 Tax=Heterostelium pallidum (strain ATCC 26659 / Pp 5 / PN500) TaxID=670386 RepID=D3BJ73_HETP5|nr:hypothetical protein PPL_08598 [Heterostelium album PN500]EFA77953.1 hypothetical protein PPL_08598 [Heterostelium album PN500]|eukprot:XP_020430081.1 hypothetical protein PPL_08598 [Heterostelium album PN500]
MADQELTSEILKKKWDRFSSIFQFYVEPQTLPVAHILIANLRLKLRNIAPPRAVLEVACGAGASTKLLLSMKETSTSLTAVDLSTEMITLAKDRLGMAQSQDSDESKLLTVKQADAEHLPFGDAAFDRYMCNFCLHLVVDPDQMLRESYRVLESGGIATFSVWGRPENSNQFTITKNMAEALDIHIPRTGKTAFHLHDIELLKKMALAAGFSKVLAGYTFNNALVLTGKEYVECFLSGPDVIDTMTRIGAEKSEQWKKNTEEYVDDLLSKGQFIGLEVAYLVCIK